MISSENRTVSSGVLGAHLPLKHEEPKQSAEAVHDEPTGQAVQEAPPQSVSVSFPSRIPFSQDGTATPTPASPGSPDDELTTETW